MMVKNETHWSPYFVDELEMAARDQESQKALQELRGAVAERRSSKPRRSCDLPARHESALPSETPGDDDPETPEERAAVEEALRDIREGRTVPHEELKRDWGLG